MQAHFLIRPCQNNKRLTFFELKLKSEHGFHTNTSLLLCFIHRQAESDLLLLVLSLQAGVQGLLRLQFGAGAVDLHLLPSRRGACVRFVLDVAFAYVKNNVFGNINTLTLTGKSFKKVLYGRTAVAINFLTCCHTGKSPVAKVAMLRL